MSSESSPKHIVTSLRVGTDWAETEEDALIFARLHLDVGASQVSVICDGAVYFLRRDAEGKEVRS